MADWTDKYVSAGTQPAKMLDWTDKYAQTTVTPAQLQSRPMTTSAQAAAQLPTTDLRWEDWGFQETRLPEPEPSISAATDVLMKERERDYLINVELGRIPNPMYEIVREREAKPRWTTGGELREQRPDLASARQRGLTVAQTQEQWNREWAELWMEAFKEGPEGFRMLAGLAGLGYQKGIGFGELAAMGEVNWTDAIPFAGSALNAYRLYRIYEATERINKYGDQDYKEKTADESLVINYIRNLYELSRRGTSVGATIGQGALELPAFIGEFIATGALYKKVATKVVGRALADTLASWAIQLPVRTVFQTTLIGTRTAESGLRRALAQTPIKYNEKGEIESIGDRKHGMFTYGLLGYLDTMVEVGTEQLGDLGQFATAALKPKLFAKFPKLGTIRAAWIKRTGGTTGAFLDKLKSAAGRQSLIWEIGEEQAARVIREFTGLDRRSADDATVFDRFMATLPSKKELAAEIAVLGIPSVAGLAGRLALGDQRQIGPTLMEVSPNVRQMIEKSPQFKGGIYQSNAGEVGLAPATAMPVIGPTEVQAGPVVAAKYTGRELPPMPQRIKVPSKSLERNQKVVRGWGGTMGDDLVLADAIDAAVQFKPRSLGKLKSLIKQNLNIGALSDQGYDLIPISLENENFLAEIIKANQLKIGLPKAKAVAAEATARERIAAAKKAVEPAPPAQVAVPKPAPPAAIVPSPELKTGKPYEAVLYRGVSDKPMDEGIYGKATYYTPHKRVAEHYGKAEQYKVSLNNPFVGTEKDFASIARAIKPDIGKYKNQTEYNNAVAEHITNYFKKQGHDGFILTDKNGEVLEIGSFAPAKQPVSEAVTERRWQEAAATLGVSQEEAQGILGQIASRAVPKPGTQVPEMGKTPAERLVGRVKGEQVVNPPPKRIISETAYQAAKDRLATEPKTLKGGPEAGAVLGPQYFKDLFTVGLYHFENGVRSFASWSAKMIEQLGERVRPYLIATWQQIKEPKTALREQVIRAKNPDWTKEEVKSYLDWHTAQTNPARSAEALIPEEYRQAMRDALKTAEKEIPIVSEEIHKARQRIAGAMGPKIKSMREQGVPSEEAIKRSTPSGELTEYTQRYPSMRKQLGPEVLESYFSNIADSPKLRPFEIRSTQEALTKFIDGSYMTLGEADAIYRLFPELGKIAHRRVPTGDRFWRVARQIGSVPYSTLTGLWDLSFWGRQARKLLQRWPQFTKEYTKAYGQTFWSEEATNRRIAEIESSPNYRRAKKLGLELTELPDPYISPTLIEERQQGIPILERIPLLGKYGFWPTARSATSTINWLRMAIIDREISAADRQGKPLTDAQLSQKIQTVNDLSMRSTLSRGLQNFAPVVNMLFAPRATISHVKVLGKMFYRKDVALAMASWAGTNLLILSLVKMLWPNDVELEYDPRSADAGKAKIGNFRFDPWTGMQPIVRSIARLSTGTTKTSRGEIRPTDYQREVVNLVRGRANPIWSLLMDLAFRETYIGEKIGEPPKGKWGETLTKAGIPPVAQGIGKETWNRLAPLNFQDMADAMIEEGVPMGVAAFVLSTIGFGVQAYPPRERQSKGRKGLPGLKGLKGQSNARPTKQQ